MSGSSSYSGGGPVYTDCTTLVIKTKLASPVRQVVDEINIGDTLSVELTPPAGPVSIMTESGKVAGSVLPIDLESLIQCISEGHEYIAKVTEINMGNCQIIIKHK